MIRFLLATVVLPSLALLMFGCGGSQASVPPRRIAVIGDSITAGYMPTGGVTLQLKQNLSYTADLAAAGEVITAAVGGASTAAALANQVAWLRDVDFDVLVVMLGTNDAVLSLDRGQALANVRAIADRWPRARLVLVSPPRWDAAADAWLAPWAADLQALANSRGARYVDAYAASLAAPGWLCHPTDHHPCESAHRDIGKLILAAL